MAAERRSWWVAPLTCALLLLGCSDGSSANPDTGSGPGADEAREETVAGPAVSVADTVPPDAVANSDGGGTEDNPGVGVCSPEYVVESRGSSLVFDERLTVEPATTEPWNIHRLSADTVEYFFDERSGYLGSRPLDGDSPVLATAMVVDDRQHESTWIWTSSGGAVEVRHEIRPPETFQFEFDRRTWEFALAETSLSVWNRELTVSPDGDRAALVVGQQDAVDLEYWQVANTFVFDLTTGEVLQWFPGRARLSPRGDTVAVYPANFGDPLTLVELDSGRTIGEIGGGGWVTFDRVLNRVVTTLLDGSSTIQVFDFDTTGIEAPVTLQGQPNQWGLGSSPDGRYGVVELAAVPRESESEGGGFELVVDVDRTIAIVEVDTGSRLAEFVTSAFQDVVAFDPSSTYAAFWSESGGAGVSVVNLRTGQIEQQFPAQTGAFYRFDQQEPLLHIADAESGQFGLFDMSTGRLLVTERVLAPDTGYVVDAIGGNFVYGIEGGFAICTVANAAEPSGGGVASGAPVDVAALDLPSEVCGFADGETVRLEVGTGTHRGMSLGFSPDVKPVDADLNGDGSTDVVMVIRCRIGGVAFDGVAIWVAGRSPIDLRRFLTTDTIDDTRVEYGARIRGLDHGGGLLEIGWEAFPLLGDSKWPTYEVVTTLEVLGNGSVALLSSDAGE